MYILFSLLLVYDFINLLKFRVYATYDEKAIHVWDSFDSSQLFVANFYEVSKTHKITCITFAKRYQVNSN
jgi:hypothetical protein